MEEVRTEKNVRRDKSGLAMYMCGLLLWGLTLSTFAQEVPVVSYSINALGQVELEVNSSEDHYYVLYVRNDVEDDFDITASMTLGEPTSTVLTEGLTAYPEDHYRVFEYAIDDAADTDGDGSDDVTEFLQRPMLNPLNAAEPLDSIDGTVILDSFSTFNYLSVSEAQVQFTEFLNGKRYAKFVITDFDDEPKTFFMNGATHDLHADFISAMDLDVSGTLKKGQIVYHPTIASSNGTLGTFGWNFSDGQGDDFESMQRCHELLASNMPFLRNNLSYYVTERSEDEYERDSALIAASRVPVLLEEDVFGELDYWGLNQKEGYGFFREMATGDVPDAKDIVLLNNLPNNLPRVGGIITSVLQTPLSHVNLRAIQDEVPNAFIRDPLSIDSIAALLDSYVYFKVGPEKFTMRSATQAEVDQWFEDIRPTEVQFPPLNLDFRYILPLDQISFPMYEGFGPKCANVATMRDFGFPDYLVPDGFGVPFYFYQEFMAYNDLFRDLDAMLADAEFLSDRLLREERLEQFAEKIRNADMPSWMLKKLAAMQTSFPRGTSIRCRSSTNNEDLPGLIGAGLYDSKTHHPSEGHIAKSIKEVYASLWNLRAFDERSFYRIDHYTTSMGVLCHPNYTDERANGVGVSADPIYQTYNAFYYLNTQVGDELITNPLSTALSEEILLDKESKEDNDFILIRSSSLSEGEVILDATHRGQLRDYLSVIHERFQPLYQAENNPTFAMEIEYKITDEGLLSIKQARPWVSYVPTAVTPDPEDPEPRLSIHPNPVEIIFKVQCDGCEINRLMITSLMGEFVQEVQFPYKSDLPYEVDGSELSPGIYLLIGLGPDNSVRASQKFMKY